MSPTVLRRTLSAATLSTALLLSSAALAGCNSEEAPKATSSEETSDAATPTPTESEAETPSEEPAGDGEQIDTSEFMEVYRAAFEDATSAHMTMEAGGSGSTVTVEGDVDYTKSPMAMTMTMSSPAFGDGEIEMRLVDEVMYMQLPGGGGKFVSMNLNDPTNPLGETFTEQMDPRSQLETFEAGIESAAYLGEEDLDGDTVDRYRVTLNSEAVLESLDPQARKQAEAGMPEELTYDLLFDGDGKFRQMEVDLGAAAGGAMQVTFSDWGKDVTVKAPPAGQIMQLPGS